MRRGGLARWRPVESRDGPRSVASCGRTATQEVTRVGAAGSSSQYVGPGHAGSAVEPAALPPDVEADADGKPVQGPDQLWRMSRRVPSR